MRGSASRQAVPSPGVWWWPGCRDLVVWGTPKDSGVRLVKPCLLKDHRFWGISQQKE